MALDLMMGSYGENHQKQHMSSCFSTPTTTTAAPIIISSSSTTTATTSGDGVGIAEKLIAHETAAGLQSVENFINFLSTTTDIHYQQRSGEPEKQEGQQVQITNPNKKQDNNSNSGKPTYEFDLNCQAMADDAVTKFRRVISLLGRTRTGHARFRRGPSSITAVENPSNYSSSTPSPTPTPSPPRPSSTSFRFFPQDDRKHNHVLESSVAPVLCPKPIKQIPMSAARNNNNNNNNNHQFDFATAALINFSSCSPVVSGGGNSLVTGSTLTGEMDLAAETGRNHQKKQIKDGVGGSVSENGTGASFQITNYSSCSAGGSGRRPPLSSASFKIRKCNSSMSGGNTGSGGGRCGGTSSGRCHCSRKRKLRLKRSVRVPAISSRMADIPPDDYSWRKYGQKPIKGSPHPRGYYKCSTVRGCPARKHVERALDDPAMLIVTYEGEHNHSISNVEATTANLILESS